MLAERAILKIVCDKLDKAGISYMLTGSVAGNFYTVPRMTRDIDIVIEIPERDLDKFVQAFESAFFLDKSTIADAIQRQGMFNIIHYDSVFKIDFIIRKTSPYGAEAFQRKHRLQFNGSSVWIISPEDLIVSKLFWAKESLSELQTKDIRNLFASLKNLDHDYISKWVDSLELHTIFGKVKANG